MKFSTHIEQERLYRMALRSPQSYITVSAKVKVKMCLNKIMTLCLTSKIWQLRLSFEMSCSVFVLYSYLCSSLCSSGGQKIDWFNFLMMSITFTIYHILFVLFSYAAVWCIGYNPSNWPIHFHDSISTDPPVAGHLWSPRSLPWQRELEWKFELPRCEQWTRSVQ